MFTAGRRGAAAAAVPTKRQSPETGPVRRLLTISRIIRICRWNIERVGDNLQQW